MLKTITLKVVIKFKTITTNFKVFQSMFFSSIFLFILEFSKLDHIYERIIKVKKQTY